MPEQRLQKVLAAAGVASRRKAEELILQGRVRVNDGVVRELGTKVDPAKDLVTVDGKLLSVREERTYLLLYKPPGCLTTASDPQGRPTALDYVRGLRARLFPVGRLDWDAEGALLLTDDGELANRLAHPRYGHRRVYLVKVKGDPDPEQLVRMERGVRLEDGPARALEAKVHEAAEKNVWIRVAVGEGRHHLVKRLCEAVGLQVQRLYRPEFGGITVEGLRPGGWRQLGAAEVRAMKQRVGLAPGTPGPGPSPGDLPKAARRHGHGPPEPRGAGAQGRAEEPGPERPVGSEGRHAPPARELDEAATDTDGAAASAPRQQPRRPGRAAGRSGPRVPRRDRGGDRRSRSR